MFLDRVPRACALCGRWLCACMCLGRGLRAKFAIGGNAKCCAKFGHQSSETESRDRPGPPTTGRSRKVPRRSRTTRRVRVRAEQCPPLHWSSVRSGDASGGTVCRHVSGALTWMSCHMRPGAWGFVETMFLHLGSVCGPRRPTVCCVRLRISVCWFYTLLTSRTHERPLRLSEAWQLGIIPFLVDGDTWQQR